MLVLITSLLLFKHIFFRYLELRIKIQTRLILEKVEKRCKIIVLLIFVRLIQLIANGLDSLIVLSMAVYSVYRDFIEGIYYYSKLHLTISLQCNGQNFKIELKYIDEK